MTTDPTAKCNRDLVVTTPIALEATMPEAVSRWRPWGKLHRLEQGVTRIHPLLDHMTDVASVLQALLQTPGLRRAAERAAGRALGLTDVARLCVLAFLHDIGKANAGFQGRYWQAPAGRPRGWYAPPLGHGPQGWGVLVGQSVQARRIKAGLPIDAFVRWGDSCEALLHASISHHGRPVSEDASESIWEPVRVKGELFYDPAEAVTAMGQAIRAQYPQAFDSSAPSLPDAPAFVHLFAGFVQLADWLGSDTRDSFFPFSLPGEDRSRTAAQRARHAVRAIGLDVGEAEARRRVTHVDFSQAFGMAAPRPLQSAMAADDLGPLVILEAETGSGKTEAALWRFLHLWRAGAVDALYVALPTRVAATQLHDRVRAFVQRVWSSHAPVVVRALPGYSAADGQTYEPLPGFEVLWHDDPSDEDAERRWAAESPKRYLAATIAVGTVDQVLLGALQIRHAHLRQAMLSRSLLVVDEVHASDAYMTRLTEQLLRAQLTCGGHALLLSATLGAAARTRYLSFRTPGPAPLPSLAAAQTLPYPAIGYLGSADPMLRPVAGNPRHKAVHWEALDLIDHPERIAALAVEAAARGARVLVVRNTVPAAVATLQAVEALATARGLDCLFLVAGVSTLHHSRFSRQDRPLLDAEVQAQIGKYRSRRGGRVVIGTQTLEQSLDIDADVLITDLCPMDVLLQRVGRLHRHARPSHEAGDDPRPEGFEQARAWILTPAAHDLAPMLARQRHGLGPIRSKGQPLAGVYVDLRVLEATRRLIMAAATRSVPADNRLLVESSTHPEALDAIAREMGAEWVAFGQEVDGALAADKSVATLHALAFDQPFGEALFPDGGLRIGSRLGAADRLVAFDEPAPRGPFDRPVTQIALRHHLLPRVLPSDAVPEDITPLDDGRGFTFRLGEVGYRYGRFGVERLAS
jgi:CRISPR-associated endonuclease/helicase Cas3